MKPELSAGMEENPHTKFEDQFSEEIWRSTYKHHEDGTIDDTFRRIAKAIASVEDNETLQKEWTFNFYSMLSNFKVVPGGRIIANAGTDFNGTTLINCYLAPRRQHDIDSIDGIMNGVLNQCQTLKSEGGWGEDFSWIRPRGSFIHGIGVETPGAVKFMEVYDKTSEIITSGSGKKSENKKAKGKIRKGAMMASLGVWHPDIEEFIRAKQQPGRLTKFNVSVNCTDDFMDKVINALEIKSNIDDWLKLSEVDDDIDADLKVMQSLLEEVDQWELCFPDTTHPRYKEEWDGDFKAWKNKGYAYEVHKTVSALDLWSTIMESTYNRAEPGVLFLDRSNYFNPLSYSDHEKVVGTNPCGEQHLSSANVCCLGNINLTQFVIPGGFDFDEMRKYVRYLVRFLDNVNTYSNAPLAEYKESMMKKRRIGVGLMGWGSSLYMLKIPFGSEESHNLRDLVMDTVSQEAYMASVDLAEEKGMFEYCEPEKHAHGAFIQKLDLPPETMKKLLKTGIRNSSLMSIQPTGNTSIFANIVSGGIEPVFQPEYIRTVIVNHMPDEIADVTPKWYEGAWHETDMFEFDKEGDEKILKGVAPDGTVYKIDRNRGLTKEVLCQDYGVRWLSQRGEWNPEADWATTTTGLTTDDHLNDLKGFAEYVDSSISKTINVPYEYQFDQFEGIYLDAYKSGVIKGLTTYRAGTMASVLSVKEDEDSEEEIILEDVKVPSQSPATVSTIRSEGKKWYLTTIMDESQSRPIAFFVHTNSHERGITTTDAVDKLIHLAESKGIPQRWVDDTKDKMSSDANATKIARCISLNLRHGVLIKNVTETIDSVEDVFVGSFLFQINKYLKTWIKDGEKVTNGDAECPECGENLVYEQGCKGCKSCGYSACG